MLKIGLTGGIGCGKSTVCSFFESLNTPVIDTDELARLAVMPGTETLTALCNHFGEDILQSDGSLNRAELRKVVFADAAKRQLLEDIVHPEIRRLLKERLSRINTPYVIIAIPLLLEKGWNNFVDRILVVDCPPELQVKRAMERDNCDQELIHKIIASQIPRQERVTAADDLITNDADLEALKMQVEKLHLYYNQLARDA